MVLKSILGLVLIVAVAESGWPCKKAVKKLDKCRSNGYVIGDCEVGDGKLSSKQRKRCEDLEEKYAERCDGDYECDASESSG